MRSLSFLIAACAFAPAGFAAPTPSPSPSTPAPTAHPSATPTAHSPTPAPSPQHPAASPASSPAKPAQPDNQLQIQRLFEQLSSDQQNKFLDNLLQWKAMTPEEQELLRARDLIRREKIATEIQGAIGKLKLKLDDDQREVFALRYTQERRKIEEAIRKETDQERARMVTDMLGKLRNEFGAEVAPTPTPAPKPTAASSPAH